VCSRVVYIDRNDFRLVDDKVLSPTYLNVPGWIMCLIVWCGQDYKGLAPNKEVMLKYAYTIKCTKVIEVHNSLSLSVG
jgi:hypothetical protein